MLFKDNVYWQCGASVFSSDCRGNPRKEYYTTTGDSCVDASVEKLWKTQLCCNMEKGVTRIFGVWPILQTRSQGISASAALILTILFFLSFSSGSPKLMEWKHFCRALQTYFYKQSRHQDKMLAVSANHIHTILTFQQNVFYHIHITGLWPELR